MADEIHSFVHCMRCVRGNQTERLEIGLTRSGIRFQCKKHGLVGHWTPEQLAEQLAAGPRCDCLDDQCPHRASVS